MKPTLLMIPWLLAAAALDPAPLAAQETPPDKKQAQTPIDTLIDQLGAREQETRRSAERALQARGKEGREALRKAADGHPDEEVRWRARRLLQQLEAGDNGALQPRPAPPGGAQRPAGELERRFAEMFERLEREFDIDVPRARFFGEPFFKDLLRQLEDSQRMLGAGPPARGQAFSFRMDQDGVRVEVVETTPEGERRSQVYEAPDLQTFREKYPDVAERYLGGRFGGRMLPQAGQPPAAEPPAPEGERLDVLVEPLSDDLRSFLALEAGVGLRVRSVTEHGLGDALGIEAGDVLLQVGGRAVRSTDDVRAGLAAVPAGGTVQVRVNRRGSEKLLSAPKPKAAEKAGEKAIR